MISWREIIVVFFVALLLFGADKIPDFARTIGKMMGEYRRVRDSLHDEIENAKEELEEVKEGVINVEKEIVDNVEEIADEAYKNI